MKLSVVSKLTVSCRLCDTSDVQKKLSVVSKLAVGYEFFFFFFTSDVQKKLSVVS